SSDLGSRQSSCEKRGVAYGIYRSNVDHYDLLCKSNSCHNFINTFNDSIPLFMNSYNEINYAFRLDVFYISKGMFLYKFFSLPCTACRNISAFSNWACKM